MGKLRIISYSGDPFIDRLDAGRRLAESLQEYKGRGAVVLGILRGGVVVAKELADGIDGELDLVFARKLGAPGNPELAIGAISENGRVVLDEFISSRIAGVHGVIESQKSTAMEEIRRRVLLYRKVKPKVELTDRIVIITDDGLATGSTMQASLIALRDENPEKLIAALPVGPGDSLTRLARYADHVVCLRAPRYFQAVGQFYETFDQVPDSVVLELLK